MDELLTELLIFVAIFAAAVLIWALQPARGQRTSRGNGGNVGGSDGTCDGDGGGDGGGGD